MALPPTSVRMVSGIRKSAIALSINASPCPSEVPGAVIGEKLMAALRNLDEVAYVRYASVYRRFEEATDFVQAVKRLEVKNDTATLRLPGV